MFLFRLSISLRGVSQYSGGEAGRLTGEFVGTMGTGMIPGFRDGGGACIRVGRSLDDAHPIYSEYRPFKRKSHTNSTSTLIESDTTTLR